MQRWGTSAAGTPRWRCSKCLQTGVHERKDNQERSWLSLRSAWLLNKDSLTRLARRHRSSTRTLVRYVAAVTCATSQQQPIPVATRILVLDGTSVVKHQEIVLISYAPEAGVPVSWHFVPRETTATWSAFLQSHKTAGIEPQYIICDGQKGLLTAISLVWPNAQVQRCLIHVTRQAKNWLTQHPKTRAGKTLLVLVRALSSIRTKRQKRRWIRAFHAWCKKHSAFLNERTTTTENRWWYTHRKVRAVRSLLQNALPNLFRFVTDASLPRTSNHVEGGVNSRLQELLRCHRGIPAASRRVLVGLYLSARQKKPTRNVY